MNNMQSIQLMDLPDEILELIFTKLNTVDVFNSLTNINQRIDNIIFSHNCTLHISLIEYSTNDDIVPLYDKQIERYCGQILEKVFNNIKWFSLDTSSLDRVLCFATYSNLNRLDLYNINMCTSFYLFESKKFYLFFFI